MVPLAVLVVCLVHISQGSTEVGERNFGIERVLESFLQNYGESQRLVRPLKNTTSSVGLRLVSVKQFSQQTGRATLGVFFQQSWSDTRLSWKDSAVSSLYVPVEKIWKPDFRLWNSLDYTNAVADTLAVVQIDGTVLWIPPAEFTVPCSPDGDDGWWSCSLKVGSWVHNAWQINLEFFANMSVIDTSFFDETTQGVEVTSPEGKIDVRYFDCCPEPYASAVFQLKIKPVPGGQGNVSGTPRLTSGLLVVLLSLLVTAVSAVGIEL